MPEDTHTATRSTAADSAAAVESDGADAEDDADADAAGGDAGGPVDAEGTAGERRPGDDRESDGDEQSDDGRDHGGHRFARLDDVEYDQVDDFLEGYVAFTPREWALARLCADFRTKTGVEMKTVGEHLPDLVPFMDEPYTRQSVYAARRDFEEKVREAGATFLYGAYGGFFAPEELDELMYEATEVAKFLLEVEGTTLAHEEERRAEERATEAMRAVHEASADLRYDRCPHCGECLDGEAA